MTDEQFDETMRLFIRRKPFFPFLVELKDGRIVPVDHPGVAIGGGGASFLTPADDLVEINCEDVLEIRSAPQEAAS